MRGCGLLLVAFAGLLGLGCGSQDVPLFQRQTPLGSGGQEGPEAQATGGQSAAGRGSGGQSAAGVGGDGEQTGGEQTGGEQTGGAETGGAETGGAQTGGAETGGAQTGGVSTGGRVTQGDCSKDGDCFPSEFCRKATCDEPLGRCEAREPICTSEYAPVCGCDHITYWNECRWRQTGTGAFRPGVCSMPKPCGHRQDCALRAASCAQLRYGGPTSCEPSSPGPDPPPPIGSCWVAATTCDPALDPQQWIRCLPGHPVPPRPEQCVDTCTAIRSETPHYQDSLGELCAQVVPPEPGFGSDDAGPESGAEDQQ